MYNYRVTDAHGKTLGVLSLENEEVPETILKGQKFGLGVTIGLHDLKVSEFVVFPVPND